MIAHESMILFCLYAGFVSHGRIRTDITATTQIVNARGQYEGDFADPRIESDVMFFQILHDPGSRIQPEGTAAT